MPVALQCRSVLSANCETVHMLDINKGEKRVLNAPTCSMRGMYMCMYAEIESHA